MKKVFAIVFFCFLFSFLNAQLDYLPLQGQLRMRDASKPSEIKMVISVSDSASGDIIYSEEQEVGITIYGVFRLWIGSGRPIKGLFKDIDFSKSWNVSLDADIKGDGNFVLAGSSALYMLPYALATFNTPDTVFSYQMALSKRLSLQSKSDYIPFTLLDDGRMGTGGTWNPWQYWSTGPNQRIHTSTTKGNVADGGLINFYWTILSSKPAIVTYDENFARHYALVAHYWSNSGRAHQHISMEVDDASGAVQTRFEFPWGYEKTVVESHSAHFRVDDGGDLFVGSKELIKEDTAKSFFYKNTFIHKNLYSGILNDSAFFFSQKDSIQSVWSIAAPKGKDAVVDIYQGNGLGQTALYLQNPQTSYALLHTSSALQIRKGFEPLMSIQNGPKVGVGKNSTKEVLEVKNAIASQGLLSSAKALARYGDTEAAILLGDVVGLNPATGKLRPLEEGDIFCGISIEAKDAALCMNTPKTQSVLFAFRGMVRVNSEKIKEQDGKVYTLYDELIGYRTPDNYIVLKGKL